MAFCHYTRRLARIYPIILAAGSSARLGFPKALARFGEKTALQIAVENCAGMQNPIVVLGHQAAAIRPAVPRGVRVVLNRRWRSGQLGSLLEGLRRVPKNAPFMIYPVDHPLLTRALIRRLVSAFEEKREHHLVVMPVFRGHSGHPAIFSPAIRRELAAARSAKDVVYRDRGRVKLVPVRTPEIRLDFDSPTSYQRCLRLYLRR